MTDDSSISEQVAIRIVNSDSTDEAYKLYKLFAPLLKDYKFAFASGLGPLPGFAVNRNFSAGAAIRSLFRSERVFVLDAETVEEMENGGSRFHIDYSISLDTNAMSYLEPHIAGRRSGGIPRDFAEVFTFIARPDVYVDPLPYFTENRFKLADSKKPEAIYANLIAYETLRTIDAEWLERNGEVRSVLTGRELAALAQDHMSRMYFDLGNISAMQGLTRRYQYGYACLLKMTAIELKAPSAPPSRKIAAFVEFCHSTLSSMAAREIMVAKAYFHQGQKHRFFHKIQKNKENILDIIRNMAWDMWHVRQLEQSFAQNPSDSARYFFPALLTFDRGLIEIMDLYWLKACAYDVKARRPLPVFDGDPFLLLGTNEQDGKQLFDRYYSEEAIAQRKAVLDATLSNFDEIIEILEQDVRKIALSG
ncbi:hypothetical protein [Rhizorhabdus wittichii]|uniref:hypothetical protein n=1 Tax=Rhizorhabdus wittichii TaxID=160791 RepID=UPI0003764AF3|nr:hypothetical protein [Rhizorhabdus wittichii]